MTDSLFKPLLPPFTNDGFCLGCSRQTTFEVRDAWLRDHYVCRHCGCIPRERALMGVLEAVCPGWRDAVIHESSPSNRGPSARFRTECRDFVPSHFWGSDKLGELINGVRNESLECLTFGSGTIDIHVTQDVLEHVFDVDQAIREIGRTLRPGGLHVFTTPLVNKANPSSPRALRRDGSVEHLFEPEFHGNPIDPSGSLVVWHFGFDLVDRIQIASGMTSSIYVLDNLDLGIRAEYIEVIVSRKN